MDLLEIEEGLVGDVMNKNSYKKLMGVFHRAKNSLKNIDVFKESQGPNWFDDIINFMEKHDGHDVMLVEDIKN
jgi:hypothetical protein